VPVVTPTSTPIADSSHGGDDGRDDPVVDSSAD
jgi:hypothetical protein